MPASGNVIALLVLSSTGHRDDVRPDFAGLPDQRLRASIDVGNLAILVDRKADRGLLVARMIEEKTVIKHHLDLRVELLDLDADRHRVGCGREIMVDVDDVFAR